MSVDADHWKQKLLHAVVALALMILGAGIPFLLTQESFYYSDSDAISSMADGDGVRLSWKDLRKYDYKKGHLPSEVRQKIDHPRISLPGFAVPLQMGVKTDHFLFVPSRAYCIHVPPPPPHLMVEVKSAHSLSYAELQGALMLTGKLELQQRETTYGQASWFLRADAVEPYRP